MTTDDIRAHAERIAARDPSRCFRCGVRLHGGHVCPPCPKPGCERDEEHEGDCGAGVYDRRGSFVAAPLA